MSETFVLNGKETPFTQGQTILDAAKNGGIEIPTLCYLKGSTPTGAVFVVWKSRGHGRWWRHAPLRSHREWKYLPIQKWFIKRER